MACSEHRAGEKVGLDISLRLYEACADFYVLESMHSELQVFHHAVEMSDGRRIVYYEPADYGWDSRKELIGISVRKKLQVLEQQLAEQFSKYLIMACGGELRHINLQVSYFTTKCLHTTHDPTRKICCEHVCNPPYCVLKYPVNLGCGCKCPHSHDEASCSRSNKPPVSTKTKKSTTKSKPKPRTRVVPFKKCTLRHCDHICSVSNGCITNHDKFEPNKSIDRYITAMHKNGNGVGERSRGWSTWYRMSKRNAAVWMRYCAEAFATPVWHGSFGGKKWETAAYLVADYLDERLSARTFIDRCWSLQHNNGCIFNKFYTMHRKSHSGSYHSDGLMSVLRLQANNEYPVLVGSYCSDYVCNLWRDYAKIRKDFDALEQVNTARRKTLSKKTPVWKGCAACLWWYNTNGIKNSCGFGDLHVAYSYCRYYSRYITAKGADSAVEPDNALNIGCAACHWYQTETGKYNPCDGTDSSEVNPDCSYSADYENAQIIAATYGHTKKSIFGCVACIWYTTIHTDGELCGAGTPPGALNPECSYASAYLMSTLIKDKPASMSKLYNYKDTAITATVAGLIGQSVYNADEEDDDV